MARILTDYAYAVYIADVIVTPEYQGKGIGGGVMSRIMAYIDENIARGQSKVIALLAAKGKEGFYEKLGFTKRPTDEFGPGMSIKVQKKEATE
ncbi:MAG: GNAT family N-acetyltransferase [Firmicutes bacterium]|nr:GNAT family N-acetyltransferase [Bacillota bacterium]